MLKRIMHPTNRRIRLLVGLLLAGLFCIQCTRTEAYRSSSFVTPISGQSAGRQSPELRARIQDIARNGHISLLEYCLENAKANYQDYTCTFIKQERLHGALGKEQWVDVKFMEGPFSVAMKWVKNSPIADRLLYIEGKNDGKMLVRPKSVLLQLLTGGTAQRRPDSKDAMKNTLRPVNKFGFVRSLESLLEVYRQAKEEGHLKESYGEPARVNGRKAIVLLRYLPAKNDYPAHKTVTYIDAEWLVPVCVEGFGWNEEKELLCRYIYKDVKFNIGLTDDDFLPQANDMKKPK